jgi:hypothetical protein
MWFIFVLFHHPLIAFHLNYMTSDLVISRFGDMATLMCKASDHYDVCLFISPDGETCQVKWDGSLQRASVTSCSNVRRFEFVGNYDEFECGVKIVADVGAVGKWSCYVKEYRSFGTGREVHADINIKIKQENNEYTSERTSEITIRQTSTLNRRDPDKEPNNVIRLEPYVDISTVQFPVGEDDQDTKTREDGGVLIPALASVVVILILLGIVFIVMWNRNKTIFQSKQNKMQMMTLKRENSNTSFNSN